MKKIILDTNFLMIPYQFNVDIFEEISRIMEEEYELIIFDKMIDELEKIAELKGKDATAARIALGLIKKKEVKIISTNEKTVDNAIIDSVDENTIVATNDKVLKEKLKNKNIKIIYLRNKKYLEMS
jgi:hypothetical protein